MIYIYIYIYIPRVRLHHAACRCLSQESKVHFGLPGYAHGTIAVNVTWIEREFNAGQTSRSMYPSTFNHF